MCKLCNNNLNFTGIQKIRVCDKIDILPSNCINLTELDLSDNKKAPNGAFFDTNSK